MNNVPFIAKELAYQSSVAHKKTLAMFYKTLETTNVLTKPEFDQLQEDLRNGTRSLRHYSIDVIFPLTGQNKIKIFDKTAQKKIGINSLNNAKLPKDLVFVPYSVQLLRGVAGSSSEADVLNTDFAGIHNEPVLTKAEITLGPRGNKLFKEMPTAVFDTRGLTEKVGELVLDESIVFKGDVELEGEIEVLNNANIDALSYGRITLIGMAAMSVA